MNLTTLEVVLTLLLVLAVAAICGLVTYIVAKPDPGASSGATAPNPGDAVLRGFAAVGGVILIGAAVIGAIAVMT